MNNNTLKRFTALLLTTLLCFTSYPIYGNEKTDENSTRILENLKTIEYYIDENYLFDKNTNDLEEGLYKGFVDSLGDSYSMYMTAEEYQSLMDSNDSIYVGIGAQIYEDENGAKVFTKIFDNSPAYKSGIKEGDILISIDGILAEKLSKNEIVEEYFPGGQGESLVLEVMSKSNGLTRKLTIVRDKVKMPTVEYKLLENQVGYVSIFEFDHGTDKEFVKAIENLEKLGMKKLIIDVRGNPGGYLKTVVKILAYILPDKEFVYTVNKKGYGEVYFSKDGQIFMEQKPYVTIDSTREIIGEDNHELKIPIVVLADENSASSSEILVGTLKDYDRAIVVGKQTYGKGIVQRLFTFEDGSALQLTISYYYTPKGVNIHNKGIVPDIEVDFNQEAFKNGVDVQLNAAIEALDLNKKL